MNDIVNYWGFLTACILLNLTPGSDTIYILTRTIVEGKKAGLMSSFGILTGFFVHILAVSVGLAQIIAHSPTLFSVLKYAGATYLCWLGIKMWREPFLVNQINLDKLPLWQIYRQGLLTNLLNPKVILFFLALLPQFVASNVENTFLPFFLLGLTSLSTTTVWVIVLVFLASPFGNLLRNNQQISATMNKICGVIFILLAANIGLVH
ncbi:LysE family translocator [Actinobacillus equuli]|uniref:LysE family translocator n=1 Tax=Actinobacillus equuli TaxID=718 RepID=UPI00244107EF|nr:LysE family translocator [Actinobacillus equuli]WGE51026.1 LysE family translocator [Actinobacillus equuli subsp. haemolyticus]WGE85833.1 LysE family translocator [Actinobacillus equuli subsp. haemolyticus]